MKGGDQRRIATLRVAQQRSDTLAHLVCCLIRKGYRKHAGAGNAVVIHQMRDAVSDHPRLAAACSGEQQQWSFNVRNGLFLLRIEAFKKIHEEGLQGYFNMRGVCGMLVSGRVIRC